MAKFTKNIERMIADLRNDEKIQVMHRDNIDHAVARRARRAELCHLFLAAYRYHKNGGAVIGYDDREAKKAAIREGIDQKFNGSALLAEMAYVLGNVEKAIKGKEVKINDEFTDLIDECRKEEEARQAEENRIRREEHAEAVKRHNKLIEHAKNVLGRDDREAKKAAIKKAIWEKYDGSTLKARLLFLIEVVQGKYNEEFKELLDEACHEIDAEKAEIRAEKIAKELREEQKNLHKWCENKAEKLAQLTGEDKAAIIDRLEGRTSDQENKRPTLSLNRTVSKRENKIITVGNKKAYQVGKGDYKHRNGVIIDN